VTASVVDEHDKWGGGVLLGLALLDLLLPPWPVPTVAAAWRAAASGAAERTGRRSHQTTAVYAVTDEPASGEGETAGAAGLSMGVRERIRKGAILGRAILPAEPPIGSPR